MSPVMKSKISGGTGCGKSMVCRIITDAFEKRGIAFTLDDDGHNHSFTPLRPAMPGAPPVRIKTRLKTN